MSAFKGVVLVKDRPERCPECGSEHIADIVYGMPSFSDEMMAKVERKEIILAGTCLVSPFSPKWACTDCGVKFVTDTHEEARRRRT